MARSRRFQVSRPTKADHRTDRGTLQDLQQIINIGPSIAEDLRRIGIRRPQQLQGADPLMLYERLCRQDGVRHDPCWLDCLLAAVSYMDGGRPQVWWRFTARRKKMLATRE